MSQRFDVAAALAEASRGIDAPQDLDDTLQLIVDVARDSMPEIDHVGISIAHRGGEVVTRAASDDFVRVLDRIQYDLGEGPCLHAMDADTIVRVENAARETRWPRFMPEAVRLGVRSQLGIRLHVDAKTLGALNMYSLSSDTISDDNEQMAELFAAHAGLALGHARKIENLNAALHSRKVIGVALGLLMQRLDIDEDTAFAYLTRISASSETKLRDIAAEVVEQHYARLRDRAMPAH